MSYRPYDVRRGRLNVYGDAGNVPLLRPHIYGDADTAYVGLSFGTWGDDAVVGAYLDLSGTLAGRALDAAYWRLPTWLRDRLV